MRHVSTIRTITIRAILPALRSVRVSPLDRAVLIRPLKGLFQEPTEYLIGGRYSITAQWELVADWWLRFSWVTQANRDLQYTTVL